MSIDPISVKERVVIAEYPDGEPNEPDKRLFTPEEVSFILKAINHYAEFDHKLREYPKSYPPNHPDQHIRMAWALLDDNVPNSWLSRTQRFFLAGIIAGALTENTAVAKHPLAPHVKPL